MTGTETTDEGLPAAQAADAAPSASLAALAHRADRAHAARAARAPQPTGEPRATRRAPARAPSEPPAEPSATVPARARPDGDPAGEPHVDLTLLGVLALRLVSPTPLDVAGVRRHLGPSCTVAPGEPDLRVRFVPSLDLSAVRWLEPGRTGFTEDGHLWIGEPGGPLSGVRPRPGGDGFEIVCPSGVSRIPLLLPLLRLAALRRGAVALHASAFELEGSGVVASGWGGGGKTSVLLPFMERGARYVADDGVLLAADGPRALGLPGPVSLSDLQMARSPSARARVGRSGYLARRALGGAGRLLPRLLPATGTLAGAGRKVGTALRRRGELSLEAATLFEGAVVDSTEPRVLFVLERHDGTDVRVTPLPTRRAVVSLAAAAAHEEAELRRLDLAHRFAFPERGPLRPLQEAPGLRIALLGRALARVRCYRVLHPGGAHPDALWEALVPRVREGVVA